jgi:hypothetical protein
VKVSRLRGSRTEGQNFIIIALTIPLGLWFVCVSWRQGLYIEMQTADPHLTYKFDESQWTQMVSIPFLFSQHIRTPDPPRNTPESFSSLLEGNETRRVGGTDTGTTVLDGLAVLLLESFERSQGGRKGTYYVMENSPR